MINFEAVRFKNINSVGNYFVEIPLNKYKNIVFVGENGAGKTTVLQAITFALYGKPFTDIKLATLINTINRKHLEVEIFFSKGSTHYKIKRGMKPDVFEIYENDDLIKQDSTKSDYQKRLDTIIGMDFKTFTKVVILGSANHVPFMQLQAKDRRSLIETLMDLEVFTIMNEFSKKDLKDIVEKIGANDNDIYKTKINIEGKKRLKEEIETLSKEKIESYLLKIDETNLKIAKLNEGKIPLTEKLKSVDVDKYVNALEEFIDEQGSINKSIIEKNIKNRESNSTIQFLEKNSLCPTCKQSLTEEYKTGIKISLKIHDVAKDSAKLEKMSDKIRKTKEYLSKVDEIRKQIDTIESNIKSYLKEINFYTKEINDINSKKESDYDTEIMALQASLDRLNGNANDLKEEKLIIEVALLLLKDNGIKATIIKKDVEIINTLINEYLSKFELFVNFTLNENFEESFKSRHVDLFSYMNFSEGEKAKINLAILFTLKEISRRKNNVSSNLMAFDETLEKIDVAGAIAFVKLLRSSKTNNLIISHDEKIISQFNSEKDLIIEVYKKGKFSYYNFK